MDAMSNGRITWARFIYVLLESKMDGEEDVEGSLTYMVVSWKVFLLGKLVCVVGRDANNDIFPIAWVVVCVENNENWKWFIDNLTEDLNLQHGGFWFVLISDQHKVWDRKSVV